MLGPRKAVTIKEISGLRIPTIPVGTEFIINFAHETAEEEKNHTSAIYSCSGLPINIIYKSEFVFVREKKGNRL